MGTQQSMPEDVLFQLLAQGDSRAALQLLHSGDDVNRVDVRGVSVLRFAIEQGLPEITEFCYSSKGVLSPPLADGFTVLHRSVELGHYRLTLSILKLRTIYGNLKDATDAHGRTPLHIAAQTENADMVALLLKYNADPGRRDAAGKLPLDFALASHSKASDEIIEQFSMEDHIAKRWGRADDCLNGTKSTFHSSQECRVTEFLENPLVPVPVIARSELELDEVISAGYGTTVFSGRLRGTRVAVKQFSPSDHDKHKFLQELQLLAHVRHPHVVLLMGVLEDAIITEHLPHASLFHAIHSHRLKRQDCLRISVQLAQALTYLHQSHPPIVHRDLKPENCLLDKGLNVKVADFGLATFVTGCRDEQSGSCVGTVRFMAPELFEQDVAAYGTEVDVWAMGCVLLELFSGERPWAGLSNSSDIIEEMFKGRRPPIPPAVPSAIKRIIETCCQSNPRRRPSMDVVLCKLQALR